MAQGIEVRHQTSCRSLEGGRCNCDPYYRASAYDKTLGKSRKAKWTQSLATAKGNRIDLAAGIRHRTLAGPSPSRFESSPTTSWRRPRLGRSATGRAGPTSPRSCAPIDRACGTMCCQTSEDASSRTSSGATSRPSLTGWPRSTQPAPSGTPSTRSGACTGTQYSVTS